MSMNWTKGSMQINNDWYSIKRFIYMPGNFFLTWWSEIDDIGLFWLIIYFTTFMGSLMSTKWGAGILSVDYFQKLELN